MASSTVSDIINYVPSAQENRGRPKALTERDMTKIKRIVKRLKR